MQPVNSPFSKLHGLAELEEAHSHAVRKRVPTKFVQEVKAGGTPNHPHHPSPVLDFFLGGQALCRLCLSFSGDYIL